MNNNNNNNNGNGNQDQEQSLTDYAFSCFKIFGIPIYVHYLLPLYLGMSFLLWLGIMTSDSSHFGYYIALLLLLNVVLWFTVLVHELCHALAGYLIGGHTQKILLWPLGGLAFTQPPPEYTNISDQNNRNNHQNNNNNDANRERDRKRRRSNDFDQYDEDEDDSDIGNIGNGSGSGNNGQDGSCCDCCCPVSRRMAQIIIAAGGPLSHLPQMLFWGLLFWNSAQESHAGVVVHNPFLKSATWTQTIYTPIVDWFWYDFFMLAFSLNFWLFLVNMCCAYPLDGSRIFINSLFYWFNVKQTAQIYCVVNGVIGVLLIVISVTELNYTALPFFAGLWSCFEVYNMVNALMVNMEMYHPLFRLAQ